MRFPDPFHGCSAPYTIESRIEGEHVIRTVTEQFTPPRRRRKMGQVTQAAKRVNRSIARLAMAALIGAGCNEAQSAVQGAQGQAQTAQATTVEAPATDAAKITDASRAAPAELVAEATFMDWPSEALLLLFHRPEPHNGMARAAALAHLNGLAGHWYCPQLEGATAPGALQGPVDIPSDKLFSGLLLVP
jgi:hypothetical protein